MKATRLELPPGYYVTRSGEVFSEDKWVSYFVNNVERKYFKPGRKIKPSLSNSGYLFVNITKNHINFYIHRLVAFYYLSEKLTIDKPQVNHKDGNKLNNNIENLEIVSQSENILHNYHSLGYKSKSAKLTAQNASQIRLIYAEGNISQKELAKMFNVSTMVVNRILNNVQKIYL